MWSYHGREFPAPTFELGMAPAGSMYSTVLDLSKFVSCMIAGGLTADGKPLLKEETVAQMFRPQFAKPEEKEGFGIGFRIGEIDGMWRFGHGGAISGLDAERGVVPSGDNSARRLGVVAVSLHR